MFAFQPEDHPTVAVDDGQLFPVRRIFCVGKNYADHVKEMGGDAKSDRPVYFTKPADAVVPSGVTLPFPLGTDNLHFEGELVLAMGSATEIFGFAAGCDLTRRDLQTIAKNAGNPWDIAKGFDHSAPMGVISRTAPDDSALLETRVNGEVKQSSPLSLMIWSIDEILEGLCGLFELKTGDLIFTGTPSGVGPLQPGDHVTVSVEGLSPLDFHIAKS